MKKLNCKWYSYILGIVLFSACGHSDKYKVEIKQLDSIKVMVDSAQLKFAAIDTSKIHKYISEINNNLDFINDTNKDTLKTEQAFLLSEYRSSRKPFRVVIAKYATVIDELPKSKKQIENLIHDLKTDKVDEAKVAAYVQDEMIVAGSVVHAIDIMENLDKLYSEKYEANTPKVLELIESLKAKSDPKELKK
ncbi:MAG: hypothetical protein V4608_17185 [Bacteroidota bacterium]